MIRIINRVLALAVCLHIVVPMCQVCEAGLGIAKVALVIVIVTALVKVFIGLLAGIFSG